MENVGRRSCRGNGLPHPPAPLPLGEGRLYRCTIRGHAIPTRAGCPRYRYIVFDTVARWIRWQGVAKAASPPAPLPSGEGGIRLLLPGHLPLGEGRLYRCTIRGHAIPTRAGCPRYRYIVFDTVARCGPGPSPFGRGERFPSFQGGGSILRKPLEEACAAAARRPEGSFLIKLNSVHIAVAGEGGHHMLKRLLRH